MINKLVSNIVKFDKGYKKVKGQKSQPKVDTLNFQARSDAFHPLSLSHRTKTEV